MDVILKGVTDDLNTPIDERVTSILRSAFDEQNTFQPPLYQKIHQHLKTKPA
jgi:hypothetical protein